MKSEELIETVRELALRLSSAEIDRASFHSQVVTLQKENEDLKRQLNESKQETKTEE